MRLWRNLAKRSAADCTEAELSSGRVVASAVMGASTKSVPFHLDAAMAISPERVDQRQRG